MNAVAAQEPHAGVTRLRFLEGVGLTEATVATLLASVFWASLFPDIGGTSSAFVVRVASEGALVTFALLRVARVRRLPPVPWTVAGYIAAYVVVILHASSLSLAGDVRFFERVVSALALAA